MTKIFDKEGFEYGQSPGFQAFSDIQTGLPFPLAGAHYDNGMEFINEPLLRWCLQRHIEATRSRPYHKNNNCYAERKNYDAVRKIVGYFRFDTAEERAALAGVFLKINREKDKVKQLSCQKDGRATAPDFG
jgi:hypothetical protein